MEIKSFGGGERQKECERILSETSIGRRLILLPIPTTRDKKYISGTDTLLSELPRMLDGDTVVAGYEIPKGLFPDNSVCDVSLDEEFLLENALLTAKGTVGYLLTHLDRDIADVSIGIVGYGRIGKQLLRALLLLGAEPTMLTTRRAVAMELSEMGISARELTEETEIADIEILVNTAPARLIDAGRLHKDALIIDLASGSAFDPCDRLVKLLSIPAKMYPVSAGRIYASCIQRFLLREGIE